MQGHNLLIIDKYARNESAGNNRAGNKRTRTNRAEFKSVGSKRAGQAFRDQAYREISRHGHKCNRGKQGATEYIQGREDIEGVYLPSQQERTQQLCT